MTKEELKQEAGAEADKMLIGSGMDRTSVIHLKHLLVTMYIQGAVKVTKELEKENTVLEKRIERAKECMKKLLFIINSDSANYNCKGLIQDAEDFIHNRTCNIRQQGEHCVSETRCIMCDK